LGHKQQISLRILVGKKVLLRTSNHSSQKEELRKGYCMNLKEKKSGKVKIAMPLLIFSRDSDNVQKVVDILMHVLADETLLSMKTKNACWNLCGSDYFELSSIYKIHLLQLNDFLEEIANRIRMLNGQQTGGFSEIITNSRLSETPGVIPNVFQLLSDHKSLIRFFRKDYRKCKESYADICTSEMLIELIRGHEKIAWMLGSFIQKELHQ